MYSKARGCGFEPVKQMGPFFVKFGSSLVLRFPPSQMPVSAGSSTPRIGQYWMSATFIQMKQS